MNQTCGNNHHTLCNQSRATKINQINSGFILLLHSNGMCHLHFEGHTMASEFLALCCCYCYCYCWVSTSGTEWSVTAKLPLINGNKNEYGHWFRDIKLIYSHWKWFLFPFEMQLSIQNRSKKGERKGKKPWTTENIFILMCLIHKKSCKIVIIVNKKLVLECDHFALDQFKKNQ